MTKHKNDKGFTLAELLIVVAIIAVLVAISIPIFSTQLEKSREATDLANVRAAYAEVMSSAILEDDSVAFYTGPGHWEITVNLKQTQPGWTMATPINIGGIVSAADGGTNAEATWLGYPKAHGTCIVSFDAPDHMVLIWDGEAAGTTPSNPDTPVGSGSDASWSGKDIDPSSYTGDLKNANVYNIDGKPYVFLWPDRVVDQYNVFPDINNAFQEITPDHQVFTPEDYKENAELKPVKRGDLFKDDSGTYVRAYDDSSWWKLPADQPYNWIKIQ